ncbi:uncharacterized protein LOC111321412 [Stylophora pistillata]|uniref:uncharacterized protein LOC111321412 n=1 Tax=Stylophora pistillata TaxID=50429 RepID=UPI000C040E12|nr:uncharacterized protein LOC111321412 [Stylophora pistillata]
MERNFKPTELISVLLLYVYVADGFRITVAKGASENGVRSEGRRLKGSGLEEERLKKALKAIDYDVHPALEQRGQNMETLKKALRSVEDDEQEERWVRDIESALKSIERETAYHESRKRTKIEKVLASVEAHTKQAMSSMNATANDIPKKEKHGLELSLPFRTNATRQEGRTISLQSNGKQIKRVFIPKGWMFCTIAPPKCYSSQRKKRHISKRHTSLSVARQTVSS